MAAPFHNVDTIADDIQGLAVRLVHLATTIRAKESGPEVNVPSVNSLGVFLNFEKELQKNGLLISAAVAQRVATKERAKTIGVHARTDLWTALDKLARDRDQRPSVIYRDLLRVGIDDLDKRLDKELSSKVFAELSSLLEGFDGAEKAQRMVRIEKEFYDRAIFIAKEYGKSMSEVTGMCIAYGLSQASIQPETA